MIISIVCILEYLAYFMQFGMSKNIYCRHTSGEQFRKMGCDTHHQSVY